MGLAGCFTRSGSGRRRLGMLGIFFLGGLRTVIEWELKRTETQGAQGSTGEPLLDGVCTDEERDLLTRLGLDGSSVGAEAESGAVIGGMRGMAAQEYAEDPVSCFRASGECVFDLEAIKQAVEAAGEPLESRDNGRMMVWLPAQAGMQYIVGVDPAGGGSEGDYSCAQVIERKTGMQCAELHGHFPPWSWRRDWWSWGICITARCWWWSGIITAMECWRICTRLGAGMFIARRGRMDG